MTIERPMFPPVDPTRRRFLTVAAIGSMIGAGSLAAAMGAERRPGCRDPAQAQQAGSGVCADRREAGRGHRSWRSNRCTG